MDESLVPEETTSRVTYNMLDLTPDEQKKILGTSEVIEPRVHKQKKDRSKIKAARKQRLLSKKKK